MKPERRPETRKKGKDLLDYPAVGMWANRRDMTDVHAWLRKIRTPRYLREGEALFSVPPQLRPARTRVDKNARVVIPTSMRKALGIKIGDEVELRIEDNELRLSTLKTRLVWAQQRLRRFIKPKRSLSKELISERRAGAKLTHKQIVEEMRELRKRVKPDEEASARW